MTDGSFKDACGVLGLSTIQKVSACLWYLAYGVAADSTDEYIRIGETTVLTALRHFYVDIAACFKEKYLCPPNKEQLVGIMAEYEQRGFPGCKGSIDGMHWAWKNCPTGWAGQFEGKEKTSTIVLEAVASKNLRIWHAFVGTPGALNDINVLNRSPIFDNYLKGLIFSSFLIFSFL